MPRTVELHEEYAEKAIKDAELYRGRFDAHLRGKTVVYNTDHIDDS